MFTISSTNYHCAFHNENFLHIHVSLLHILGLFCVFFYKYILFARLCDVSFSYIVVRAISHTNRSQWSFVVWQFGLGCHLLLGVSLRGVSTSTVLCESVLRSLFNILTGLDQQIGFVSDSLLCFTIAFGGVCLGICFS